jgi:hypothetical protein
MRHQAFEISVRGIGQRLQDVVRGSPRTETAHAGVDLEVVADGLAGGLRDAIQLRHLVERMDGGRKIEFREGFALVGQKSAHHQNAGRNAATAQRDALFHGADRQPSRAFRDHGARDFQRAVTVGVGLHHGGDFHAFPNHGSDGAVIAGNPVAGYKYVGAVRGGHYLLF